MKKILASLCVLATILIMAPLTLVAQEVDVGTSTTILTSFDFQSYFISLAALVPLVILLAGFVKKWLKAEGFWAQFLSWVISIALCYIGWLLKIGMFTTVVSWWIPLLYGFCVGLASNGFFKIEFIQAFLALINLEKKKT